MSYRALEKLINLHDGYRRVFRTELGELLLLQEQGQAYLVNRRCPHRGHYLDDAYVEEGCVTCPLHHLCFSLETGESLNGTGDSLDVYSIAYEGNSLGIEE